MQERQADGGSNIEGKKTDEEHTTRIQKDAQDTQGQKNETDSQTLAIGRSGNIEVCYKSEEKGSEA